MFLRFLKNNESFIHCSSLSQQDGKSFENKNFSLKSQSWEPARLILMVLVCLALRKYCNVKLWKKHAPSNRCKMDAVWVQVNRYPRQPKSVPKKWMIIWITIVFVYLWHKHYLSIFYPVLIILFTKFSYSFALKAPKPPTPSSLLKKGAIDAQSCKNE